MFPPGKASCHDVKKLRPFKRRVYAQRYGVLLSTSADGPSADIVLPRETPDNIAFFPSLMRDPWGEH